VAIDPDKKIANLTKADGSTMTLGEVSVDPKFRL
jgi:hypothetical protein